MRARALVPFFLFIGFVYLNNRQGLVPNWVQALLFVIAVGAAIVLDRQPRR